MTKHSAEDVAVTLKPREHTTAWTTRERAQARMARAKGLMTRASAATLRGDLDAARLTKQALDALHNARAELAALDSDPASSTLMASA